MQEHLVRNAPAPVKIAQGLSARLLVSSRGSAGVCAAYVFSVGAGVQVPRHRHEYEDCLLFVLAGRFDFQTDGEWSALPAGSTSYVPRKTAFALRVAADAPAEILVTFVPAGMDLFVKDLVADRGQSLQQVLEKHGIVLEPFSV